MEQPSERQATARFGRFFRLLVGDPNATEQDDLIDLTEGTPDLARIEMRLRRLERGVGAVADALKRSHAQTAASIDRMQSELRERDRVTRSEVQRMLWQALGPLAASIERLSQSMRDIPPAIESGDAMIDKVHAAAAARPEVHSGETQEGDEVHTSALWSWAERGVADP
ncbi:MAG TPA: hypothetical protein VEM41_00125 [Actinomycetota bacterium]|nr:hypothetical protein [Actinomycetota bacterium]